MFPKRFLSFDMDGCLYNQAYLNANSVDSKESFTKAHRELKQKDLIIHNTPLLDKLISERSEYATYTVLHGSNRQSWRIDQNGVVRNPLSGFHALQQVSEYLRATINPFLMPDLYSDLPHGTSFKLALDALGLRENPDDLSLKNQTSHADWLFDESKFSLIYAQLQLAAEEAGGQPFNFDFFDDRSDIIEPLAIFFSKYSYLIPKGCKLRMHQYAGEACNLHRELQGTGQWDEKWRETIKSMYNALPEKRRSFERPVSMLSLINWAVDPGPFSVLADVELKAVFNKLQARLVLINQESPPFSDTVEPEQSSTMRYC